jgi:glutathione synthase/RimK-type ligase-like ATP-grasp enzyme
MILIITHKEDFTADFIIEKLNSRGISYFRLNCEDIDKETYCFENTKQFSFDINGITSFDSVWFRRPKLPELEANNEAEKLYLLNDYDSLLENIYLLIDSKKWLSHPKDVYQAENKLLQLKIAQNIGFLIPDTLITNSHKKLEQFIATHQNDVIIKPIRQGRILQKEGFKTIFTNKIDDAKIKSINEFDLTPSIFQEYISKEYEIRVTVVGNKVFSAKVNSQSTDETKIDWRKEKIPFEKYDLPKSVSNKCVEITKTLNLSFGAIDLIKNQQGDYVFLEINPNGQWAWLETEAELKISDEIINFLTTTI